jgi:hypothetical protein
MNIQLYIHMFDSYSLLNAYINGHKYSNIHVYVHLCVYLDVYTHIDLYMNKMHRFQTLQITIIKIYIYQVYCISGC